MARVRRTLRVVLRPAAVTPERREEILQEVARILADAALQEPEHGHHDESTEVRGTDPRQQRGTG